MVLPETEGRRPTLETCCRVLFFAGATVYLILLAFFGRFPVTDEIFFKAPGRQWSVTGRFAAPELEGFLEVEPPVEQVWTAYTPCYSFLFGVYCKVVGFGWRQCVLYDALIHVALAGLTYLTLRRVAPGLPPWIAPLVGLAILPLGQAGRPDELAMCFGMAGLLPLLAAEPRQRTLFVSGLLFGASACTSVGAALVLGLGAALTLLGRPGPLLRRITCLFAWGMVAALAVIAAASSILLVEPGAHRQYLANARVLGSGFALEDLRFFWRFGRPVLLLTLSCLVIALLALGLALRSGQVAAWTRLWSAPLGGAVFVLVVLSGRYTYLWFAGPWLLCAATAQVVRSYRSAGPRVAGGLLVLLAVGFAAGCEAFARQALVLLQLPRDQSFAYNAANLRKIVPEGSVVLTDEYWWGLADRNRVFDLSFSRPRNLSEIDFVILNGNGSGQPGCAKSLRPDLAGYITANFRPVYDNMNRSPAQCFGFRLTSSAYGFGPLVLRRGLQGVEMAAREATHSEMEARSKR